MAFLYGIRLTLICFLDPRPMDGSIKSPLSVCPSVRPSVSSALSSGMASYLFLIFRMMVDNWNV